MATNGMGQAKPRTDRVVNSGQRKTVGTSIYSKPVDAPSGTDFRAGCLEHKEGVDKDGGALMGAKPAGGRKQVLARNSMSARNTISVSRPAQGFEQQNVQSNGRIMQSAIGARPRQNFAGGRNIP